MDRAEGRNNGRCMSVSILSLIINHQSQMEITIILENYIKSADIVNACSDRVNVFRT